MMTDQQEPERIWITGTSKCGAWNVKPNPNPSLNEHEKAYVFHDLLEAAEKRIKELEAENSNLRNWVDHHATEVPRLTAERDKLAAEVERLSVYRHRSGVADDKLERLSAMNSILERKLNQALASVGAVQLDMRDRAAERIESIGFSAGLIRALPLSPDATDALNEMLAEAWEEGRLSSALDRNPYRKATT